MTAEAFFHAMRQVYFRDNIDKSTVQSGTWYDIEFDIPLEPWDEKNLIIEFSHNCPAEMYDQGAIVESTLYYDESNGNAANLPGRTQYMIVKHDKCGNYPYAGLNFVNMESRVNTFIEPTADPGATQVLIQ